MPDTMKMDDGWRLHGFRRVLDFSLIAILPEIYGIIANNDRLILTVSTFNTEPSEFWKKLFNTKK